MAINSNTKAPVTGSSVTNKQLSPTPENVERKIMLVGTYDPSITTVVNNVPKQVFSPEDVASQTGFGFMLHRMAIRAFSGGNGVPVWITPQAEAGGAAASTGTILYSGASIGAGTHALYIAGVRVAVTVSSGDLPAAVSAAVVAAINADTSLPVTAVVNATPEQVDLTAKSKGPWGDDIDISVNILDTDESPANLAQVITGMASGTGVPDIQDALDGMGTGDNRNSEYWTGMVHGYGQDTTTLDAVAHSCIRR
jgi:phage tail sheath gpL-like